jgi:hypothetical protein
MPYRMPRVRILACDVGELGTTSSTASEASSDATAGSAFLKVLADVKRLADAFAERLLSTPHKSVRCVYRGDLPIGVSLSLSL